MLLSFPIVNDTGAPNGAEVTLRLTSIVAIEHLTRFVRSERSLDREDRDDIYELVPGCIQIYQGRNSFNVTADYAALKELMLSTEWNEE